MPLLLLKRIGFVSLFGRGSISLLSKRQWYYNVLLLVTVIGALTMYFLPKVGSVSPTVVLFAIPISIVAGTGEEILWRGVYIRSFPGNIFLAYLCPSVWFAI